MRGKKLFGKISILLIIMLIIVGTIIKLIDNQKNEKIVISQNLNSSENRSYNFENYQRMVCQSCDSKWRYI